MTRKDDRESKERKGKRMRKKLRREKFEEGSKKDREGERKVLWKAECKDDVEGGQQEEDAKPSLTCHMTQVSQKLAKANTLSPDFESRVKDNGHLSAEYTRSPSNPESKLVCALCKVRIGPVWESGTIALWRSLGCHRKRISYIFRGYSSEEVKIDTRLR